MTPDQRLRWQFTHIADLPERPNGYGLELDEIHEWLRSRFGTPLGGRWSLLGLRGYFRNEADRTAFCEAWGATPECEAAAPPAWERDRPGAA